MTNFVLLYTGGTVPESEEQQQAVMASWGAWYGMLGEKIVDGGNPFSMSKHVTPDGTIGDGPAMDPGVTGYTVISAESLDEAAGHCKDHPHTKYGGSVTIFETFQM